MNIKSPKLNCNIASMMECEEQNKNVKDSTLSKQSSNLEDKDSSSSASSYGWVIVIAAFMTNFIIDGIGFSVGIFMIDFLDYFEGSKAKISLVGSVLNSMYLTVGTIVGVLANRFGCRLVAIIGGFISAISFLIASFSPSVEVLTLTYGAMAGFGFGLVFLPANVMVGHYFNKRRAFASGIAACGSGIGAFVFAPLCYFLLEQYSWKGATWIISGIAMHGVIIGALLRPVDHVNTKTNQRNHSDCNSHTVSNNKNTCSISTVQSASGTGNNALQEKEFCVVENNMDILRRTCQMECKIKTTENVNEFQRHSTVDKISSKDVPAESKIIHLKHFSGFVLLKNPVFVIYAISCYLAAMGFFIPFFFLPDYAIKRGVSGEKAAFLISIIGIANTIVRVLCGFISDWKFVDCVLFNNLALIIAGAATILCPFYHSFELLTIYSIIFGFGIAVFISLHITIIVEMFGQEQLTIAFGWVIMFEGLATFIGGPIAGSLYDRTGNYNYSFYMAGLAFVLAGLINLPARKIDAYIKRKKLKKTKHISSTREVVSAIVNDSPINKT